MKYSYILVVVGLLVSTSADSLENKNEWYPNINKEINPGNNNGHRNVYLPPVIPMEQHSPSPVNKVYPNYPSYNIRPVANVPQQPYYYPVPVNTFTEQPTYVVPATVPAPIRTYLPAAPQYSHYTQPYVPQINQVLQKPATLLSIPYDIGMKGLGIMSQVFDDVHHGIDSLSGFLQPPPVQTGGYHGYESQKSVPLGYGYGNRNWQVQTPAYNQGVYAGYDSNLGKNYGLYYPGKGSIYGYNNLNGNRYPGWNVPNNAGNHGNYYYVH